ncbi:MAG: N-acetylglucosamine-6-phosphate deacetylase [Thermoguttaceae bacterium]
MNAFCIQNGQVVLADRVIAGGTVVLADGRIRSAGPGRKTPRGADEIDARGGYVVPGLLDMHIHGAGMVGWETCTRDDFEQIRISLAAHGILRFVPTMMADEAVIGRVAALLDGSLWADCVPGIYVEGPFINPGKRGGIQEDYVRPVDLDYLAHLQKIAGGRIRLMTFAPELEGAEQLPAAMRRLGIQPCVGHSLAGAAEAAAVCGRGRTCATHLFNAMSGLDHRRPGLAAFALNADSVYAELNPDGTHVAPELLQLASKAKRVDRMILISDAVISAGAQPGTYEYMNRKVKSTPQGVYYEDGGTLIGSSSLLDEGVRRFARFTGAPLHQAVRMASLNPAALLGLDRRTGSLEPGKWADLVIFPRNFGRVRAAFWKGTRLL